VILRSLALGMLGWIGSVLLGWLAVAVAAGVAMALAPPGRRIFAGVWAVVGGWAVLMLVSMPFITPVSLAALG
jgi:hypothetical protein